MTLFGWALRVESVTDVLLSLPAAALRATPSASHNNQCPQRHLQPVTTSIVHSDTFSQSQHPMSTATPSVTTSNIHSDTFGQSQQPMSTTPPSVSHNNQCPQRHHRSVTTTNVHSDTFGQSQQPMSTTTPSVSHNNQCPQRHLRSVTTGLT